jgi:excisionase family DNA binding protein
MAISEATKDKIRSFILHRPGEYMLPNDIAKMFHVTAPTVKAQFHFVAATNGGHTDAIRRKGMAYIPMKKEPTVEETMQKSIDDAVEAFSKRDPDQDKLNTAIAEAILSGDCKQHPKERIDISNDWTIKEAAEYFGVTHETIRKRVINGEIKSYKVLIKGRYETRIKAEDIEEFEKTCKFKKHVPHVKNDKKVKKEDTMAKKTKEDIAAEVLGLPDRATCDKLKELEQENLVLKTKIETKDPIEYKLDKLAQENLVLRTKVAIYERLIFGKDNTDGVL